MQCVVPFPRVCMRRTYMCARETLCTHSRNTLVTGFPCVPRHPWPQLSMTEKEGGWEGASQPSCPPLWLPPPSPPLSPHSPTSTPPLATPPVNSPSTLRFLSRERLLFLTLSSSFSLRSCSAWASKSLFLRRCLAACAMASVVGV